MPLTGKAQHRHRLCCSGTPLAGQQRARAARVPSQGRRRRPGPKQVPVHAAAANRWWASSFTGQQRQRAAAPQGSRKTRVHGQWLPPPRTLNVSMASLKRRPSRFMRAVLSAKAACEQRGGCMIACVHACVCACVRACVRGVGTVNACTICASADTHHNDSAHAWLPQPL